MISIELRINYAHNFVNFTGEDLRISFISMKNIHIFQFILRHV